MRLGMRAVEHEPGKAWQREGGWIGAGIASAATLYDERSTPIEVLLSSGNGA
jgi:hypothetical protein